MCARSHLGGDFVEMPLHGLSVATREDDGGTDATPGANGAKDIGGLGALIPGCAGPGSSWRPTPSDLVLLTDSGFVLPPEFYGGAGREPGADFSQRGGKVFFLKSSMANSFCA